MVNDSEASFAASLCEFCLVLDKFLAQFFRCYCAEYKIILSHKFVSCCHKTDGGWVCDLSLHQMNPGLGQQHDLAESYFVCQSYLFFS